jgi:hypothetical protein
MKSVLTILIDQGLFEALHIKSDFSLAWSAIECCFSSEDLSRLMQQLKLSKVGDMQTKLASLYYSLTTVRTLKGYLKDEVAGHVVRYAEESRGYISREEFPVLLHLKPEKLIIFRKALRLLQVDCFHFLFRPPLLFQAKFSLLSRYRFAVTLRL